MRENDGLEDNVELDVTPMATIGLILVVIFVSSSTTWMQPLFKVNLPKADTAEAKRQQNVTVSIGASGELSIDDIAVSESNLFEALRLSLESNDDKCVILRADQTSNYGKMLMVMDMAKKCGATNISIATEQKTEKTLGSLKKQHS
jgi:biopolymer transport protein ExbD